VNITIVLFKSAPFQKGAFILSDQVQKKKTLFYTTRDLMIMAVLAALGGVASTYIQMFANMVNAFLGFPGATQWAAGLHVLWIILAIGITQKPGTGIITGILKGSIELMSGNTHGVIILLVNLIAGLLVDFGFLFSKNKQSFLPFILGGGLAAGSNVLVFQIFARIPIHILTSPAILILVIIATISGIIFAGILGKLLIESLAKAGVVKQPDQPLHSQKLGWLIVSGVFLITVLLSSYLIIRYQSPDKVTISGAVAQAYKFPDDDFSPEFVNRSIESRGSTTTYQGFLIYDLIQHAEPDENADTLLIMATDGYSFLLSFSELQTNPNILITQDGRGQNTTFNVVGPVSSKAWVKNIMSLSVIAADSLTIVTQEEDLIEFNPDDWLDQMDSTQINLPTGSQKLQGVPLHLIIESSDLIASPPKTVLFYNLDSSLTLNWNEIENNDSLRIFTVIESDSISYALADMSGEVYLFPTTKIELK
jgi:ABC-type thiamin/hydroxymethylpyrimidine transport system permease subunit